MTESWARTISHSNSHRLVAYISPDDPTFEQYKTLELPDGCRIDIGHRRYISETYNIYSANDDYDYFVPLNDDHYCITPEWDVKLIALLEEKSKGWGCAMADDKLTNWNEYPHPSGCVISRKTVRAMGYMFYPKLHHIGNDVIMGKLFTDLGILHGTKDVVIEHRHWVNSMRTFDDNYKWVYGKEEQDYGDSMVKDYLFNQYPIDKKKLQEAMANETS